MHPEPFAFVLSRKYRTAVSSMSLIAEVNWLPGKVWGRNRKGRSNF